MGGILFLRLFAVRIAKKWGYIDQSKVGHSSQFDDARRPHGKFAILRGESEFGSTKPAERLMNQRSI